MYVLKFDPESETLKQIDNLIEDIEQSITEPEFGCKLLSYVDRLAPQYIPRIGFIVT